VLPAAAGREERDGEKHRTSVRVAQSAGLPYDIEAPLELDPEPDPMLGQFASLWARGVVLGVVVVVAAGVLDVAVEPPFAAASAPPPPAASAPPTARATMSLRGEMGHLLSRCKPRKQPRLRFW
jgi:hypothetical protein